MLHRENIANLFDEVRSIDANDEDVANEVERKKDRVGNRWRSIFARDDRRQGESNSCKRKGADEYGDDCLLYTSPSPRDATLSRMPSSA